MSDEILEYDFSVSCLYDIPTLVQSRRIVILSVMFVQFPNLSIVGFILHYMYTFLRYHLNIIYCQSAFY